MGDLAFKDTTATKKIFELRKRIRAVSGGTSASKTISILVWIMDYGESTENKVITVVAESVPHLQLGAIRDFQSIMMANNYWDDNNWNETKHQYLFSKGTLLEFISFDKFGKAHGPRRDVLFLNEANNIPYKIADQLITRTRETVWMDWNPSEEFWFYTEMNMKRPDIDFITLTYKDNEALDEVSRAEIESHKHNREWWTVYGLGQLGVITSRIYRDWQFIEEVPHEARLERGWLDFGYTNDPSSLGLVYYYNGGYVLDTVAYRKGMSNKVIADTILNSKGANALWIADSAEPKSIDEIRGYGVNIIGVEKKRGETKSETFKKWSIGLVQNQRISITTRSVNEIREYRNYMWKMDKSGRILNEPEHEFSHSMDGISYAFVSIKNVGTQIQPNYVQRPYEPISAFEGGIMNELDDAGTFKDNTISF